MADNTFHLKVFSGRGLELEAEVTSVTAPSVVGELGFLTNHCDYVGLLDVGIVQYVVVGEVKAKKIVVTGGLCTFANNTLNLLADSVDLPEMINVGTFAEGREVFEVKRAALSQLDPEFDIVAKRLGRIEAIETLLR